MYLLFTSLLCAFAQEWNFPAIELPKATEQTKLGYVHPNELDPIRAKEIWQAVAPGGVHLSVGSERSFVAAGLIRGVDTLLLTDIDPEVVQYNRVNALLLKLSTDREDYVALRTAKLSEWKRRANSADISPAETDLLLRGHRFWSSLYKELNPLLAPLLDRSSSHGKTFQEANYLRYEAQFNRIQELAKRNAIWTLHINLFDSSNTKTLSGFLASKRKSIHSLDVSNAWTYRVASDLRFVKNFSEASTPDTLVVLTRPSINELLHSVWDYAGLQWRYLERTNFLKDIDLGDSRLRRPFTNTPIRLDCATNLGFSIRGKMPPTGE